jgi:hypothetical protein
MSPYTLSWIMDHYGDPVAAAAAKFSQRPYPAAGEPYLTHDELQRLLASLGIDGSVPDTDDL